MKSLIKNFQNFSHEHSLWKKGDRIVLGVSGGPDSMCLLDVFLKLQKKYDLELIVAHVNYNLRGNDSQKDEELVKNVATKNNLAIFVHTPKNKFVSNREEAWRKIRYDFFEKIRKENNFNLIAVAHNADDQVETFFLNLFRGAGIEGLSGMKPRNKTVIRPLLFASKKDILEYNRSNNIAFRIDRTNKENVFLRNRVRNILIPLIEKNFNPNIKKTVQRTIGVLSSLKTSDSEGLRGITASHIREIIKIARSQKNKNQLFSFGDLKVERRGDRLIVESLKSKSL
ncbi:MAG: tRNA lysidine(34) synthetase TilS [Patescibacteria group bacterium]